MATMMRITLRYECGECGWRWSRDGVKAPIELATHFQPARVIVVPAEMTRCCGPEDETDGES